MKVNLASWPYDLEMLGDREPTSSGESWEVSCVIRENPNITEWKFLCLKKKKNTNKTLKAIRKLASNDTLQKTQQQSSHWGQVRRKQGCPSDIHVTMQVSPQKGLCPWNACESGKEWGRKRVRAMAKGRNWHWSWAFSHIFSHLMFTTYKVDNIIPHIHKWKTEAWKG